MAGGNPFIQSAVPPWRNPSVPVTTGPRSISSGLFGPSTPAAAPVKQGSGKPAPVPAKAEKKPKSSGPIFRNTAELITLKTGPNKTKFVVHKEFAVYHSPVLKAAFNSDFIEGQTQTYTLKEPSEITGRLLVHWLYFQQLDIIDHDDWELNGDSDEDLALMQLWILADKLIIPRLQNEVTRKMHQLALDEKYVPRNSLPYLYENTPKDSLLRRFVVDLCACYMKPETYSEEHEEFPKEMLLELAVVYATKLDVSDVEKALGMGTDWAQYQVEEK